jgi:hypothetical protein
MKNESVSVDKRLLSRAVAPVYTDTAWMAGERPVCSADCAQRNLPWQTRASETRRQSLCFKVSLNFEDHNKAAGN